METIKYDLPALSKNIGTYSRIEYLLQLYTKEVNHVIELLSDNISPEVMNLLKQQLEVLCTNLNNLSKNTNKIKIILKDSKTIIKDNDENLIK